MNTKTGNGFVLRLPRVALLAALMLIATIALPASASAQTVADCQRQINEVLIPAVQSVTITGQNADKNRTVLLGKLTNANQKLDEGKFTDAILKLTDFQTKVGQLRDSGAISVEDAARLIGEADTAIECIESLSPTTAATAA